MSTAAPCPRLACAAGRERCAGFDGRSPEPLGTPLACGSGQGGESSPSRRTAPAPPVVRAHVHCAAAGEPLGPAGTGELALALCGGDDRGRRDPRWPRSTTRGDASPAHHRRGSRGSREPVRLAAREGHRGRGALRRGRGVRGVIGGIARESPLPGRPPRWPCRGAGYDLGCTDPRPCGTWRACAPRPLLERPPGVTAASDGVVRSLLLLGRTGAR